MSFIVLDIDEANGQFVLSGDLTLILNNYRAKHYFKDVLKAVIDDTRALIIYEDEQKEITLKRIQEALDKYNIPKKDTSLIKETLNIYYKERENFDEFSKKAKKIWNNEFEKEDFLTFKNIVNQKVKRTLYDKQFLAAFHLAFSQNACNFSVPGSGKTTIVYAAYAYLKSLPIGHFKKVNKLLIIGPLSSFGPWEDEYLECFGENPFSIRLAGGMSKEDRDRHFLSIEKAENTPEITLMSYQSIPNNFSSLLYFLQKSDNKVMVVLDEAHRIKNVDGGVWAQSTLNIAKFCSSRVILTGTPLPNGYEDIYNLFEFIWPEKNVTRFSVYQLRDMTKNKYDSRISQLIENVSPYFVRIKKDHLDLEPAINHPPTYVEMGPIQREIYDQIENKYLSYFSNNEPSLSFGAELAKARFLRLMQVATNPNLLLQPLGKYFNDQGIGDELHIDDTDVIKKILLYKQLEKVPQKFKVAKSLIEELLQKNERVVVWGTFIQNIKEFQEYLKENGIQSKLLIGEVPVERDDINMEQLQTREKIIREFHQSNSSFQVIIANPFAVAESISLHKACHNAIYLERTFNATHFIQSKDRIHRVGLPPRTSTHYHYILSSKSIDETIHARLLEKEQRMLELVESQEIPLFSENLDYDVDLDSDIKAIIRDYVRRASQV